ncbi:hypothetical protein ACGFI4_31165 [Micromonospora carbonacea]|uniref:hypothetical protein n=1 Tax=Micromonospora carbonacea TaxID=47853 RepID=UPI00371FC7B2
MADPVLITEIISCAGATLRVADTLAQWIILWSRREVTQALAVLPRGIEVREQGCAGQAAKPGHK